MVQWKKTLYVHVSVNVDGVIVVGPFCGFHCLVCIFDLSLRSMCTPFIVTFSGRDQLHHKLTFI